jgi:uncharacterized protein
LKQHGWFGKFITPGFLATRITESQVNRQIVSIRQILFEVTDSCNLNCTYCGYGDLYGDYDKRGNKNLSFSTAKRLLDFFIEKWKKYNPNPNYRNVYIGFYGGEPMINMKVIENIVEYLHGINLPGYHFTFNMTTNAVLLNKHVDFFVKNEFKLLISLDGDEKNNGYRLDKANSNAFNRIVQNLLGLRSKYPDYFERNVSFNAVLHNLNSVKSIHHFIKCMFNKTPRIAQLNPQGIKESKREEFEQYFKSVRKEFDDNIKLTSIEDDMFLLAPGYSSLDSFLKNYTRHSFHTYNDLFRDSTPRIPTGTCFPFAKKIFLTVNGKLLPCERIGQQYHLGNVTSHNVILDFSKIVERYNNYYDRMEPQCVRCNNSKGCDQCIFLIPNLDKKPVCNMFLNEDGFRSMVAEQLGFLEEHPYRYKELVKTVNFEW